MHVLGDLPPRNGSLAGTLASSHHMQIVLLAVGFGRTKRCLDVLLKNLG